MFSTRHGIADRLSGHFDQTIDVDPPGARLHINLDVDRFELGVKNLVKRG